MWLCPVGPKSVMEKARRATNFGGIGPYASQCEPHLDHIWTTREPAAQRSDIMDSATQEFIVDIIDHAQDLTLATIRDDGYPQATTVSFAHDGLTIYVGVGKESQKVGNIRRCPKVSLTINNDYKDWGHIKGLSMAAQAEVLNDPAEIAQAESQMMKRFPQFGDMASPDMRDQIAFLKIKPQLISVLDYEKGFGHTDLVSVQ
jgi:general stress protein 26